MDPSQSPWKSWLNLARWKLFLKYQSSESRSIPLFLQFDQWASPSIPQIFCSHYFWRRSLDRCPRYQTQSNLFAIFMHHSSHCQLWNYPMCQRSRHCQLYTKYQVSEQVESLQGLSNQWLRHRTRNSTINTSSKLSLWLYMPLQPQDLRLAKNSPDYPYASWKRKCLWVDHLERPRLPRNFPWNMRSKKWILFDDHLQHHQLSIVKV